MAESHDPEDIGKTISEDEIRSLWQEATLPGIEDLGATIKAFDDDDEIAATVVEAHDLDATMMESDDVDRTLAESPTDTETHTRTGDSRPGTSFFRSTKFTYKGDNTVTLRLSRVAGEDEAEAEAEGGKAAAAPGEDNDFSVKRVLGQGGMGVIYIASQNSLGRDVAVKMILPGAAGKRGMREKLVYEALVTGELDHPNIIPVYELGLTEEDKLFYAMKIVQGKPWSEELAKKPERENIEILLRICDALAFAHDKKIIHRDLKPENVMLGDYGEVMLMDWGLAVSTDPESKAETISPANAKAGTPAYMAPEMALGEAEKIGPASDIYLLGAILYEILTGRRPHTGRTVFVCLAAAAENFIQKTDRNDDLMKVAMKAMACEPADRYASVKQFQQALVEVQAHAESVLLAKNAAESLAEAKTTGNYETFAQSLFAFREAAKLWDGNRAAKDGERDTRLGYAAAAFGKGDYDLALDNLEGLDDPEAVELAAKAAKAKREAQARKRRVRILSLAALGLVGLVVVILIGATIIISDRMAREREARQIADKALEDTKIAQDREREAAAAREQALVRQREADAQRLVALDNQRKAQEQAAAAAEAREQALIKQQEADAQRLVALESERKAQEERAAALEKERKAQEERAVALENERKAQEERARAQEERAAALESEKLAQEQAAAAAEAREQALIKQREADAQRLVALESERRAQEARARAQEERAAALDNERRAQEERARAQEERAVALESEKLAQEQAAAAAEAREQALIRQREADAQRLVALESERRAQEERARAQEERLAALARAEEERLRKEEAERAQREVEDELARKGLLEDDSWWVFDGERAVEMARAGSRQAALEPVLRVDIAGVGAEFGFIPSGEFVMGSSPRDPLHAPDEFIHRVELSAPYYMGAVEVTRGMWRAVVGVEKAEELMPRYVAGLEEGGQDGEEAFRKRQLAVWGWRTEELAPAEAELPATGVSPEDIDELFLPRVAGLAPAGWRLDLPSEAQWEFACRAGSSTHFWNGDSVSGNEVPGWTIENSEFRLRLPGQFAANPWGLFDVHGNAGEIVRDFYSPNFYLSSPNVDPVNVTPGPYRVFRGGSWAHEPRKCRSAARNNIHVRQRYAQIGFRLALVGEEEGR